MAKACTHTRAIHKSYTCSLWNHTLIGSVKIKACLCLTCVIGMSQRRNDLPPICQGRKKNNININFWVRISCGHPHAFARMPRGQKVSSDHRGHRKTHFLVRTSMMIFGADVHFPKSRRKILLRELQAQPKKFAPTCTRRPKRPKLSRSETWVPKRGGLKPAGKRQESATFLQRSFFDVAVQFFVCCSAAFGPNDFRTAEKRMLQCSFCSAAFRKLQRNFRFRLWHVAGAGFRGVGFRTCWKTKMYKFAPPSPLLWAPNRNKPTQICTPPPSWKKPQRRTLAAGAAHSIG